MGCMLPQGSVWPWGRWPLAAEAVPDGASSWTLSTARICHRWSISTSEKGDLGDTSLYLSYRSIFGKSNKIQGTNWGHECVQSRNPESKKIRKQGLKSITRRPGNLSQGHGPRPLTIASCQEKLQIQEWVWLTDICTKQQERILIPYQNSSSHVWAAEGGQLVWEQKWVCFPRWRQLKIALPIFNSLANSNSPGTLQLTFMLWILSVFHESGKKQTKVQLFEFRT